MYSSTLSSTLALGEDGQLHALATLHPGRTQYAIVHEVGWAQGRSALRKVSPQGFDFCSIPSVASRHTDYSIPAQTATVYLV
jgi:hypothetical protein